MEKGWPVECPDVAPTRAPTFPRKRVGSEARKRGRPITIAAISRTLVGGILGIVDQTSSGATGRRIRVLGILVGACLLIIAAALAILPMTVEVAGSTADCGVPAFALRAPSEPDDKGFDAVDDACSGAGFGRLFKAFVFGGAGVAAIVGARRLVRTGAAGVDKLE